MMFFCIISKTEAYNEAATLLKDSAQSGGLKVEILFIEDMVASIDFPLRSTFYFLTNHSATPTVSRSLEDKGHGIINLEFLKNNITKSVVQEKIKSAGVNVPILVDRNGVSDKDFPVYIKSEYQNDFVKRVVSKDELENEIKLLPSASKWYLEKDVEGQSVNLNKIYYINGWFINRSDEKQKVRSNLSQALNLISSSLDLKIFSADIFLSDTMENYLCIDVNPAPGFYNSSEARKVFVSYLSSI